MAWDGSWRPPTAYECSPSPCICLYWIWGSFHVGLEPQSLHNDNKGVCSTEQWSRISADFQNMSTLLCWYWHDDGSWCLSTHSIWMLSSTLYISSGYGDHSMWVWSLNHWTMRLFSVRSSNPGFQQISKIYMHCCVDACWCFLVSTHSIWIMMDPNVHPQHMNILQHLAYVCSGSSEGLEPQSLDNDVVSVQQ